MRDAESIELALARSTSSPRLRPPGNGWQRRSRGRGPGAARRTRGPGCARARGSWWRCAGRWRPFPASRRRSPDARPWRFASWQPRSARRRSWPMSWPARLWKTHRRLVRAGGAIRRGLRRRARWHRRGLQDRPRVDRGAGGVGARRTGIRSLEGRLQQGLRLLHRGHPTPTLPSVPADYIRKQTLKNAERYITPELKEYEDDGPARARSAIAELEYELLRRRSRDRRRRQRRPPACSRPQALGAARRARARWPSSRRRPGLLPPGGRRRADASRSRPGGTRCVERSAAAGDVRPERLRPRPGAGADHRSSPGRTWPASRTYMRQVALIALLAQMRQLRAGRARAHRRRRPHLHARRRAATTSRPGSARSWSR